MENGMRNILVLNKEFWILVKNEKVRIFSKKIDVSGVVDIGCGTGNYLTILPKK